MSWLMYCRAGFEPECAQEAEALAAARGVAGRARTQRNGGWVVLECADEARAPSWREPVFARQSLTLLAELSGLDPKNRLGPVIDALRARETPIADLWVETPDSDEGSALAALAKGLEGAAISALKREKLLAPAARERAHLLLAAGTHLMLGLADAASDTPWRGGIPRLKLPREAPSRSALKIEEAWLVLLDERERARWLAPGLTAVDLGAAPGGWSWQLARRSIRVIAVDNGPLAANVIETGIVTHVRADGFRYRPRKPVDWLVCDMVEQPARVAALVGEWLAGGHARAALFNLKLPMKKRWLEAQACFDGLEQTLAASGKRWQLRAKQLYHDREEITVVALPG